MYSIAIIEDSTNALHILTTMLTELSAQKQYAFRIAPFPNGELFCCSIAKEKYDIVFMDIDLPGINGLDTARHLREVDPLAVLIFTTNLAQYALQGYEVNAMDYMLKPIRRPALEMKLERALRLCQQHASKPVFIKTRGGLIRVLASDIHYIDIFNHHITFHTASGAIESYGTLDQIEAQLNDPCFFRSTASCIINLKCITQIDGLDVMIDQNRIPISRLRKKEFWSAMNAVIHGSMPQA